MPALRGTLTYSRFFVEGEGHDTDPDRLLDAIRLRVHKPLEPVEDDLERTGWAAVGDPYELDLTYDRVFYNQYVNLSVRTDRWVFPGAVVRARLRDAEAAYLAKKGRERLSKREKGELKLLVLRKLRRELSPAVRAVDLSWDRNAGIVRFFAHAPAAIARMNELFARTFALRLVPEAPYTLAARIGLSKAGEAAWQALEPTHLGGGAAR